MRKKQKQLHICFASVRAARPTLVNVYCVLVYYKKIVLDLKSRYNLDLKHLIQIQVCIQFKKTSFKQVFQFSFVLNCKVTHTHHMQVDNVHKQWRGMLKYKQTFLRYFFIHFFVYSFAREQRSERLGSLLVLFNKTL